MRILRILKEGMFHICIAASIACITFKILDWYNPFMDFEGNGAVIQYLLYICALGIGVCHIFTGGSRRKERRSRGKR